MPILSSMPLPKKKVEKKVIVGTTLALTALLFISFNGISFDPGQVWLIACALLFAGHIIGLSFCQTRSRSTIRSDYIRQHRTVLGLLVLLWGVPICSNILIRLDQTDSSTFDVLNTIAFFCILASTGVVNIVRMAFDKYLRQKVIEMICFRGSAQVRS